MEAIVGACIYICLHGNTCVYLHFIVCSYVYNYLPDSTCVCLYFLVCWCVFICLPDISCVSHFLVCLQVFTSVYLIAHVFTYVVVLVYVCLFPPKILFASVVVSVVPASICFDQLLSLLCLPVITL